MKLLKHAYRVGDGKLISKVLKIMALQKIAEKNKILLEKIATIEEEVAELKPLTPIHYAIWSYLERKIIKYLTNQAYYAISQKGYQRNSNLTPEDLVGEGVVKILSWFAEQNIREDINKGLIELPYNWIKRQNIVKDKDQNSEEEAEYLSEQPDLLYYEKKFKFIGKRHIFDKAEGSRRGIRGDYFTDYSAAGVPKPVADDSLPQIMRDKLDEIVTRETGITNPYHINDHDRKIAIQKNMPEIQAVYNEWVEEEIARRKQQLKKGKEFKYPSSLDKILGVYNGRINGFTGPQFAPPSSLDAPAIMGSPGEESGDTMADRLGVSSLLDLLGTGDAYELTEDIVIRNEVMNAISSYLYQIPIPYRLLMAAFYNIPYSILEASGELTNTARNIVAQLGLRQSPKIIKLIGDSASDEATLVAAMRSNADGRLSWSAAQKILKEVYGKGVLKGIANVKEFEENIKKYWAELIEQGIVEVA